MKQYAICPLSYKAISVPRHNGTGGGIAIMFKDTVSVKCESVLKFKSMECVIFKVAPSVSEADKHHIVIYKPPDTSVINFLKDLTNTMEEMEMQSGDIIFLGDFNIRINEEQMPDTMNLLDFMKGFYLINKVTFPTNCQCNTIDLILTPRNNIVCYISEGTLFSGHHLVMFIINISCTMPKEHIISLNKKAIGLMAQLKEEPSNTETKSSKTIHGHQLCMMYTCVL